MYTFDFWLDERMTQRGPWAELSRSQQRYYRGIEKKVEQAQKAARRAIQLDPSATAVALARDLALMDTFSFDIPMNQRQPYVNAERRIADSIFRACGFRSSL